MGKRSKRDLIAIVLAAGQGTRMNSQIPKVLHSVCGTPMIDHVLAALGPLDCKQTFVVTGHLHDFVREHVGNRAVCVYQPKRLGTAHAVRMVLPHLRNFHGDILVCCGDTPLIRTATLQGLVQRRRSHHTACAVLTTTLPDPKGYGRIVRNRDDTVRKIVEEKDTNTYEEKITEVNTGSYCFDADELVWALAKVSNNNAQKEFYLTDTVEILNNAHKEVEAHVAPNHSEVIGVNNRRDMAIAERILRLRILDEIMDRGVTILDPASTYIDNTVQIGIDTTIHPFSIIRGNTVIGEGCEIGPNVLVTNSVLGQKVHIRYSVMEEARVDNDVSVGPYAYVRPGTLLRENSRVGTFVEVARTDIGRNADVLHLAYLGDSTVGDETYVGAGTLTCNFDGSSIQRTEIGSGVFVGFNSLLVAPVKVRDSVRIDHNKILNGSITEPVAKPSTRATRGNLPVEGPPPAPRKKAAKKAGKKAAARASASRPVAGSKKARAPRAKKK